MALEMHPNDNAREGKPALWIFEGRSVAFLVGGVVRSWLCSGCAMQPVSIGTSARG